MYQLFRAFWYGDRSLDFLLRHTDFRRLRLGEPAAMSLPSDYVAVKFYTGPALPDTETNRTLLFDLVQRVARRLPVVMLDTAWSVDEHRDYEFDGIPGVTTLRPSLDQRPTWDSRRRSFPGPGSSSVSAVGWRGSHRFSASTRLQCTRRSVSDDASLCGEVHVPPIRSGALDHTQSKGAARRRAILNRNGWIKCQKDRSNKPRVAETQSILVPL